MIIGKLDRVIEIRKPTASRNAFGEKETNYDTVFATVFASWKPRTGNESYEAEQLTAIGEGQYEIRRLDGVNEKMKIVDESGEWYDILSIVEIGRREGHLIDVRRKDNDG